MRRSTRITSLIAGGSLLSASLAGCEDPGPQEAQVYSNLDACSQELSAEDCRQALAEAQRNHLETAPKFASREECEQEIGAEACQAVEVPTATGGSQSVFMPMLMGFMLGRMLSPRMPYGMPVYVGRDGFARTGGTQLGSVPGGRAGLGAGTATVRSGPGGFGQVASAPARGGFGSTGRSFGGGMG
ncbi:MAG TPA: DUF1190 domain-containing protein [Arenibaculum sp.]|nr:DUF1190 domain-containing protein [Arenibaculum sp.]